MQSTYDPDKRRLLTALSHGSIFISTLIFSIGIPIAILFVSDDPVVKENAKEAINFHLNVWLWGIIVGILVFLLVGYLIVPFFFVYHWALPIWAIVQCLGNQDYVHRYPFIFRVV
ncbi:MULTISPECIES: DUF4870 domain-containing protein [unclassified Leptolyngbya]|uniref:DUF4870 domain-containing protein n=1 Tax=unclassified Leptolyngbya TaxID=2650499 RepID=UPI001687F012|nr:MULTISPECIES: DUF4870 domain-containing protein [unclassified Leptolyngbya]MBD1911378.1 DUF4870 domain-containing protein [Leptolyngbya sp. FACHB-8]MBD2156604.1 DUF4870 domain-containing protein [Leptolyngbya sp. FACHB-16]